MQLYIMMGVLLTLMQNGKMTEQCIWKGDLNVFQHPYTQELLKASHLIQKRYIRPAGRDIYKKSMKGR